MQNRPRSALFELGFYVSFGAGVAFGTSSFTMLSGMFGVIDGAWFVAALALAALACVVVAWSVAEMASMFPAAPGIRTYLKVALGNRVSLTFAYLYLAFMPLAAGVESYMFALVLQSAVPALSPTQSVIGLLVFTLVVNLAGYQVPRTAQIVSTVILLVVIIAASVMGLWMPVPPDVHAGTAADVLPLAAALPVAAIMGIYLFVGFEWVTMLGFNPDAYRRRIPLAMPVAIAVNLAAYAVFALALKRQLPGTLLASDPTLQIPYLVRLIGAQGVGIGLLLSVMAIFSTLNAGLLGGARLIYALAREGSVPRWCGVLAPNGVPIGAFAILGTLTIASALTIVSLRLHLAAAVVCAVIVSFVYAAYIVANLQLRKSRSHVNRPFRSPAHPMLQRLLAFLLPCAGALALFEQPDMAYLPAVSCALAAGIAMLLAHYSAGRLRAQERRPHGGDDVVGSRIMSG